MVAVGSMTLGVSGGEHDARGLSRDQLIDWILTLNPTATRGFLGSFSAGPLATYLDHLIAAQSPRGRAACWVRRAETPAIVGGTASDED